jgi:hypothetical protein
MVLIDGIVSGEVPEEPVVSKKTGLYLRAFTLLSTVAILTSRAGTVFEKRLVEKFVEENGKDPVTGEEMDLEDLLPIKTARVVRPRPPTLTSIPALLSTFQNEWDALALETYKLKQQLAQTREELATALYQHDAAVRVIARLSKERDEARDALSKITVSAGAAANGDAMAVDNEALPEELAAKVDETHQTYVYASGVVHMHLRMRSGSNSLQTFQEPEEASCAGGLGHIRGCGILRQGSVRISARTPGVICRCGGWLRCHQRLEGRRCYLFCRVRAGGEIITG